MIHWLAVQDQPFAAGNDLLLVWGFILLAVAIGLVVIELFVPSGGLIGLLSGVAAIGSLVAFFRYDTTWGFVALGGYVVLGPIAAIYGFRLWINSPLAGRIILGGRDESAEEIEDEDVAAASERARAERLAQLRELIGAEGVSVTALRPVGTVKINGQRLDALAETGVITANTPVVVTEVYDNQIKVRAKH